MDFNTLNYNQIRLMVATNADGCLPYASWIFCFTKERKVIRLLNILKALDIDFNLKMDKLNRYIFRGINKEFVPYCSKNFDYDLIKMDFKRKLVFIKELFYWDGSLDKDDRFSYSTINFKNILPIVSIFNEMCINYKLDVNKRSTINTKWQDIYRLRILRKGSPDWILDLINPNN